MRIDIGDASEYSLAHGQPYQLSEYPQDTSNWAPSQNYDTEDSVPDHQMGEATSQEHSGYSLRTHQNVYFDDVESIQSNHGQVPAGYYDYSDAGAMDTISEEMERVSLETGVDGAYGDYTDHGLWSDWSDWTWDDATSAYYSQRYDENGHLETRYAPAEEAPKQKLQNSRHHERKSTSSSSKHKSRSRH